MRYILIILVFLSVGAKSQMVIKAHANYRPYAQPAVNLLLDDYPNAAAAYSLRKLDKDYTGNCVRIRRDSTGQTEQDFGFDASGYLDTTAIKNFCRANTGRLVTWYDQSGNSRNISQSTSLSQPILWNGNAFQTLSSTINDIRKAPLFDGVTTSRLVASFTTISQPITTFSVVRIDNASPSLADVIYDSYNNTASVLYYTGGAESVNNRWTLAAGTNLQGTTAGNTNPNLFSTLHNGASSSIRINSQSYVSGNAGTNGMAGISIGGIRGNPNVIAPGYSLDGRIAELIVYGSDQSSNRTAIENNINDYYNIYWNGDFTGLLDTYGSSAAAYSLRNLSSTYKGPLIRVRKDTTGQPEMDIYGDYYGNLDTVGLKNFLLTRSGFVTTWYDQSGNARNTTQATQANQPRIALNGVIDRRSGDLALVYDGTNDYLENTTNGFSVNNVSHYAVSSRGNDADAFRTIYSTGILAPLNGFGFFYSLTSAPDNVTQNRIYQQIRNLSLSAPIVGDYTNTINANNLIFGIGASSADTTYFNGANQKTTSHTRGNVTSTGRIIIGARWDGGFTYSFYLNGTTSEIVFWNSNQSSNRTGIESNINTYYGIY